MRFAFQLITRLEKKIFINTISLFQVRLINHRPRKILDVASSEKPKCLEPKPSKKSMWNIFKRAPDPKCFEKEPKKTKECETVPRPVSEEQAACDIENISRMGGTVYRTCGQAYVLQKDVVEPPDIGTEPEEKVLEDMMKDPSLKGQCDPMPPFESVEKRLLDLSERKLHPLYKRLMSIPKKVSSQKGTPSTPIYKSRSGPIMPEEVPKHLKLNKEIFEKKNILCEFKKAYPPQQMVARLAEMRQNEKPTIQKKRTANKQQQSSE